MDVASIKLINVVQAAEIAGMKHIRLARLAREGKVPHVRLPDGELRFILEELHAWILAHHVPQENTRQLDERGETAMTLSPPQICRSEVTAQATCRQLDFIASGVRT